MRDGRDDFEAKALTGDQAITPTAKRPMVSRFQYFMSCLGGADVVSTYVNLSHSSRKASRRKNVIIVSIQRKRFRWLARWREVNQPIGEFQIYQIPWV